MHTIKIIVAACILLFITSCKKWSAEDLYLSAAEVKVAQPISDTERLCNKAIKGTMLAGKTYTIECDVTINAGDTLFIQPGVHINVKNKAGIFVQGALVSLGTKTGPVWITVDSLQTLKNDALNRNPTTDAAFAGGWAGLYCSSSCKMLILKWTHIEFGGAGLSNTQASLVNQSAGTAFSILFQNPSGIFVMEDSWLYGGVDDPIRISNGKVAILRNTFEKGGLKGGDCLNTKGGTVGDMAYNLFVGIATNGQKASNKGIPVGAQQTNINMWNNTFISCGWRQIQTGRGANINFEEGARGMAYNNLMVNCKFGMRIVNNPAADTANIRYGNNYYYADSLSIANQIYPTNAGLSGGWVVPKPTDIPDYTKFLPANYQFGATYDGTYAIQKNNPLFYNFPLPMPAGIPLSGMQAVGNYDFRILTGSPAIGKGFTGFSPLAVVPTDAQYGVTEMTLPGADIGAFQFNGTGNQHHP